MLDLINQINRRLAYLDKSLPAKPAEVLLHTNAQRLDALSELRCQSGRNPQASERFENALKLLLEDDDLLRDWFQIVTDAGVTLPPEEIRESLEHCLRTTPY